MAYEVRGDISELVVVLALEAMGYQYGTGLHWRNTSENLKVCDSDVTVGDANNPDALFQVCSSGYEGGYQKKFWRDMGELIEVRRVFPECRLFSVLFEAGVKDKLRQVSEGLCDSVIDVADLPGGQALLLLVEQLADGNVPSGAGEKINYVRSHIPLSSLVPLIDRLRRDFALPVTKQWNIHHSTPREAQISELNFRKAFLTASLFAVDGDFDGAKAFFYPAAARLRIPEAPFIQSLNNLGICSEVRTILGSSAHVMDQNLISCLIEVGVERFAVLAKSCVESNPATRVYTYGKIIRSLPDLEVAWFESICAHYERITDPETLSSALQANFNDFGLWLKDGTVSPEPWLFRRLLDLIRAADGLHFAIGIPRFDPVFKSKGLPALRFTISEYIAGRRALTRAETDTAASVLVPHLQRIKPKVTLSLFDQFKVMVRRSEFNQRLITYRGFDPLPVILAERFGTGADTITPEVVQQLGVQGAATCAAHVSDDTISMWQSASRDGVSHKVKELVGRMGLCCLKRQQLPDGTFLFSLRDEWSDRVLYVDGSWGERETQAVLSAIFTQTRRLL